MHELVRRRLHAMNYDIVQIEGIGDGAVCEKWRMRVRVFDDHNCEYLLRRQLFDGSEESAARWRLLIALCNGKSCAKHTEAQICRRSQAVSAVSPADAQALKSLTPELDFTVIPNGIDLAAFTPSDFNRQPTYADLHR